MNDFSSTGVKVWRRASAAHLYQNLPWVSHGTEGLNGVIALTIDG